MNSRKIIIFILCAFLPMAAIGAVFHWAKINEMALPIVAAFSMLTPLLAVIITQKVSHEPLFRGMGVHFHLNKWWLIGWLLTAVLAFAILGAMLIATGNGLSADTLVSIGGKGMETLIDVVGVWGLMLIMTLSGLFSGATINALFAFCEEIGWRGFLVKEFAGMRFIPASLFIGILWGAWHSPLILNGYNFPDHPVAGVFLMVLFCVTLTPIFLYFRLKGKSVIVPSIMHGTFNALVPMSVYFANPFNDITWGLLASLVMLIFSAALFIYDHFISREDIFKKPLISTPSPQLSQPASQTTVD